MAEAGSYSYDFRELITLLIKKQDIHRGHWFIHLKFGLGAGNVPVPGVTPMAPAAIVTVVEIGIQKIDEPNPFTVDAAKVNPKKKRRDRQPQ